MLAETAGIMIMISRWLMEFYTIMAADTLHIAICLLANVKITNLENNKSAIAYVLDRGPYAMNNKCKFSREVDCSYELAKELDFVEQGVVDAKIEPLS